MKISKNFLVGLYIMALFHGQWANAQDTLPGGYQFSLLDTVACTPVQDQYKTSTCWSFSVLSFLESEMLRKGGEAHDLSEMFVVRQTYAGKAKKYVRMHGKINFSGGGALNDPIEVYKKYGMVPEGAYPGLVIGGDKHKHYEMDGVLKAHVDEVIDNANGELSPAWYKGFTGLLDAYLGEYPSGFEYEGISYTPATFAESLDIEPDEYVLLSSFTHHPFYEKFVIEVPDNWSWGEAYNIPIDEMRLVFRHALEKGYSIAWATDISDPGFEFKKGLAIVPKGGWEAMTDYEKSQAFEGPVEQAIISQQMRQEAFDNYLTTDDHGMHIVGKASDQNGEIYYKVKNSWGADGSRYHGYLYASEAYILYKTVSFMLHRDALPKNIQKKLGL